ncbi:hypothetical protein Tco_0846747, partial [Tanacetum coccineum]
MQGVGVIRVRMDMGDKEVTKQDLVAKVVMEVLGRLLGDMVVMSLRASSEIGLPKSCGTCSFPSVFLTTDVGWLRGVCSLVLMGSLILGFPSISLMTVSGQSGTLVGQGSARNRDCRRRLPSARHYAVVVRPSVSNKYKYRRLQMRYRILMMATDLMKDDFFE